MTKKEAQKVAAQAQRDGWQFTGYRKDGNVWGVDLVDTVSGYPVHFWSQEAYQERMTQIRFDQEHKDFV